MPQPKARAGRVEPPRAFASDSEATIAPMDAPTPASDPRESEPQEDGFRIPSATRPDAGAIRHIPSEPRHEPQAPREAERRAEEERDAEPERRGAIATDARDPPVALACPDCGDITHATDACGGCGFQPTEGREFLPLQAVGPLTFVFGRGAPAAARALVLLALLGAAAAAGFVGR